MQHGGRSGGYICNRRGRLNELAWTGISVYPKRKCNGPDGLSKVPWGGRLTQEWPIITDNYSLTNKGKEITQMPHGPTMCHIGNQLPFSRLHYRLTWATQDIPHCQDKLTHLVSCPYCKIEFRVG